MNIFSKVDLGYLAMKSAIKKNAEGNKGSNIDFEAMMAQNKDSITSIVQKLANSHSVDAVTLSSLLVDYREWVAAKEANEKSRGD